MGSTCRHARLIYTAESLARDTFQSITSTADGSCATTTTISLQKEFQAFTRLAIGQFESLKTALSGWRERVRSGDVEFTSAREDDFKSALRASANFLSFLLDTFNERHRAGLFLMHPRRGVGLMESHRKEAERILNSWQSPEWETANERTVKWDKDQSRYLREKLASSN